MKLGLRPLLAVCFFIASIVPLAVWASWISASALEREIERVEDQHLLIARNLSRALDRYAADASAVFSHVVAVAPALETPGAETEAVTALLSALHFRHICLVDLASGRVTLIAGSPPQEPGQRLLPPVEPLIAMAEAEPDRLIVTDVTHNPEGEPAIFLIRKTGPDQVAIGELGTAYLRDTQRAVAFGEGGHAAIVDASGNVLGHPNTDWEREIRNLAQVDAVARMMRGETGVSQFFSPAAKADMIAGFTTVPATGWGVMIPQPLRELEVRADTVRDSAYLYAALGTVLCAFLGWFVGGFVTRPIRDMAEAVDRIAAGGSASRVEKPAGLLPREVDILTTRFNDMVVALDDSRQAQHRALQAAEEAAETKSDFVARVTHELRTPLNTVIGFSGMIRDEAHGPIRPNDYVDYARLIHESGQRLLEMVNDIIAFARLEGRGEQLSESVVDTARLLRLAAENAEAQAQEGGVTLTVEIADSLPSLWADEIKLRQSLSHVVANAVKFTPRGGRVTLGAALTENGGLALYVRDTGIGIAESDIATALSPFGQISSQLARAYEGAGLGLPLAKMLTELHGGSLRLTSEPGIGTEVALTFPPERVGVAGTLRERLS